MYREQMAHHFPIRCECNQIINHKYLPFKWITSHTHKEVIAKYGVDIAVCFEKDYCAGGLVSMFEAMDMLQIPRQNYCCRTKFMTFVEIPDMDPTLYEDCIKVEILLKPITEVTEPKKFIAR